MGFVGGVPGLPPEEAPAPAGGRGWVFDGDAAGGRGGCVVGWDAGSAAVGGVAGTGRGAERGWRTVAPVRGAGLAPPTSLD